MLRRTFLQGAGVAAAAAQSTPPGSGIRLGFDSFSIRDFKWKAIQLLDYAAGLKLDSVQLSSLEDFESLDPAYLQKVKDHAAHLGIGIDAGVGSVCSSSSSWDPKNVDPTAYLIKGLKVAHAVGASKMRCFQGSRADRVGRLPIEAHMENTIKAFRSVRNQAGDLSVKIALENHAGDMQAREVKTIIEESGKDFVGSCLDTGNPVWAIEDPNLTLEILGPYVLTTHVRDSAVYEHPRGAVVQWLALGDGNVDLQKLVTRYREVCPGAAMQLEIITGRKPEIVPYLEPDFWKAFPKTPAWEFTRFVALAKSGKPFLGDMIMGGWGAQPEPLASALREQERTDLERSLEYAKKVLGVGVRWKG
jgi:3-oxoisoapionate decarboxylase